MPELRIRKIIHKQKKKPNQHKSKSKLSKKHKKKKILWSISQNKTYGEFLKQNENLFKNQSIRRQSKVFKLMSDLIPNKTPTQCKSHHQKMMFRYQSISQILQFCQKLHEKHKTAEHQNNIQNPPCRQLALNNFKDHRVPIFISNNQQKFFTDKEIGQTKQFVDDDIFNVLHSFTEFN